MLRAALLGSVVHLVACGRIGFGLTTGESGDDALDDAGADAADRDSSAVSCTGSVPIGSTCDGGGLFAGTYPAGSYMVTPSGCTDSTTPVCDGSPDSLLKTWYGTGGMFTNIPGVENTTSYGSTALGDVNTATAAAHASVTADSAIRYCADLVFGGHSDWYLPASLELTDVLLCHSDSTAVSNLVPYENPNCAVGGGKTSQLTGFAANAYWTSTESDSGGTAARRMDFDVAVNGDNFKDRQHYVRCVRRF